jgi:hypothetical protein
MDQQPATGDDGTQSLGERPESQCHARQGPSRPR